MGTTLTGKNISASYLGLIKTTDNAVISATAKRLTDGNGTDSSLYLSTTSLGIGITPTSTLHVNGDANINNLTVGLGSGSISTNTVFGNNALNNNTTGYMNVAIGVDALRNNTDGDNNIAIGRLALSPNTSGIRNVALGSQSLTSNTTGSYNVGLGYDGLSGLSSGGYNIGIGYEAGNNITTGTGSIMIGGTTRSSAVTSSNEIVIGYNTTGNGSNTVTIGNSSITTNYFSGDILLGNSENLFFGNTSDVYISGTTVSDNIQLGVGGSTQFTFSQASGLRLHQYGGGTITGTATQRLGVDSSGNVIEIPIGAGAVDGSGTANTVTMWTDSDTIGNAPITISGNNSTFAGTITASGGSSNNNDDANILTLNASEHARLLVDTSSTSGHRATLALESNGNELTLSTTGSVSELTSVGNLTVTSSATTFAGDVGIGGSPNVYSNQTTLTINGTSYGRLDLESGGTIRSSLFSTTANTTLDVQSGFFSIDVGGSERMRLDSSGNLGLATTSASSFNQLTSQGTAPVLVVGGGTGNPSISIFSANNNVGSLSFADGTTSTEQYKGLIQYNHSNNELSLWTNANKNLTIDSSGNVAVGTANTSQSFKVNTPTLSTSFPSYFNVDGSYSSKISDINIKAVGVLSGGGYGS